MAKKAAVNKSALIREALAAHRSKAPAEIATLLNEKHGLKLTAQYVSTIKSNARKKKGRRTVRSAARRTTARSGGLDPRGRSRRHPSRRAATGPRPRPPRSPRQLC